MATVDNAFGKARQPASRHRETMLFGPVDLSVAGAVSAGNRRLVFEHPGDPHLLIKVMKPGTYGFDGQPLKLKSHKLPRREGVFASFAREFSEYIAVRVRSGANPVSLPVGPVHGVIETNLGLGLVVTKVTDRRGNLAPTLRTLTAQGPLDLDMRRRLAAFFDAMIECHVVVHELTPDNIVLADGDDGPRFVCIDGLGPRTLFSVESFIKSANTRKLRRYQRELAALTHPTGSA